MRYLEEVQTHLEGLKSENSKGSHNCCHPSIPDAQQSQPYISQAEITVMKTVIHSKLSYIGPIWNSAVCINLKVAEAVQNPCLRMTTNAPWYVRNFITQRYLDIPFLREHLVTLVQNYFQRTDSYPNELISTINTTAEPGRFRRPHQLRLSALSNQRLGQSFSVLRVYPQYRQLQVKYLM